MLLELGIFLGVKKFGGNIHSRKKCMVMDREQHRYHSFISDFSGQDIHAHDNNPELAIRKVRDWLRTLSQRTIIPGGSVIIEHYELFLADLPEMCSITQRNIEELTFNDCAVLVTEWLAEMDKQYA